MCVILHRVRIYLFPFTYILLYPRVVVTPAHEFLIIIAFFITLLEILFLIRDDLSLH